MIPPSANNIHRQVKLYFEKAGKIYLITIFPLLNAKNPVDMDEKDFINKDCSRNGCTPIVTVHNDTFTVGAS
ncbi:hypothetical protein CMU59_06200 [Elizabethkingia anophelis]|nr:hypothetical protein [Elizabethkingia anophelis]MDV3574572.1 hypothetical protein [Elizabethkingia anophelis]MDV3597914.1 hypothetical protein [Elizabethkingia anophelis]MDV3607430.1 hypothetical protein [Elizabethkingia anophelis]MDV3638241.1 hypothetical protein [Elizabethkingia anophelis]